MNVDGAFFSNKYNKKYKTENHTLNTERRELRKEEEEEELTLHIRMERTIPFYLPSSSLI